MSNNDQLQLIGTMYMALGRMDQIINRVERILSSSQPQPPRQGNPPSDLRPLTSDLCSGVRA